MNEVKGPSLALTHRLLEVSRYVIARPGPKIPIYYFSPELIDSKLPCKCKLISEGKTTNSPHKNFALIELEHDTENLPKIIIVTPKGGPDLKLKFNEDIVFTNTFDGTDLSNTSNLSIVDLSKKTLLDWGALTLSEEIARERQTR